MWGCIQVDKHKISKGIKFPEFSTGLMNPCGVVFKAHVGLYSNRVGLYSSSVGLYSSECI